MPRGEALGILRHLVWVRFSLDMVSHLNHNEPPSPEVTHPYNYLGNTMPEDLKAIMLSSDLSSQDRIDMRHIAIVSNLEGLFELIRSDPREDARSLWPDSPLFRQRFSWLVKEKYQSAFRPSRNWLAHILATPKASSTAFRNWVGAQMEAVHEGLGKEVVNAVGLFEEALRTQMKVEMENQRGLNGGWRVSGLERCLDVACKSYCASPGSHIPGCVRRRRFSLYVTASLLLY
jgi:hypothetical protein